MIATDVIRPTASGSGDLVIDLERPNVASDSAGSRFGTLLVKGDASVSGTLHANNLSAYSARLIQLESAQADVVAPDGGGRLGGRDVARWPVGG